MQHSMYLRLGNELVGLKQQYDETIQELKWSPANIKELREKVEQLAEQIVMKQTYFNSLLNPTKYGNQTNFH